MYLVLLFTNLVLAFVASYDIGSGAILSLVCFCIHRFWLSSSFQYVLRCEMHVGSDYAMMLAYASP